MAPSLSYGKEKRGPPSPVPSHDSAETGGAIPSRAWGIDSREPNKVSVPRGKVVTSLSHALFLPS